MNGEKTSIFYLHEQNNRKNSVFDKKFNRMARANGINDARVQIKGTIYYWKTQSSEFCLTQSAKKFHNSSHINDEQP